MALIMGHALGTADAAAWRHNLEAQGCRVSFDSMGGEASQADLTLSFELADTLLLRGHASALTATQRSWLSALFKELAEDGQLDFFEEDGRLIERVVV